MLIKERSHRFDNIKALLITLVVLGHFADYYTHISSPMRALFFTIYIFHMPLFIFLSGLFIKSTIDGHRFKFEKVISYFLMYILLKLSMYVLFYYGFNNTSYQLDLLSEDSIPWYLFAMAVWICMVFTLKKIRRDLLILISIVAGLLVGYFSSIGDDFVLSRIIVFFPFFLLGYYINVDTLNRILSNPKLRIASFLFLIILIIIVTTNIDFWYKYRLFLSGRNSYSLANQVIYGAFYRLFFYGLASLTSFAILSAMTKRKTIFTYIGARTLQIFILHRFVLWTYHYFEINTYLQSFSSQYWTEIYIAIAVLLTLILSWKPFGWLFNKIMQIQIRK